MDIPKTLREIAEKLESNNNPDFIKPEDIEVGMKLKPWFYTEYTPTKGNYAPCDVYILIKKIDGDIIFWTTSGGTNVNVTTKSHFKEFTLLET